MLALCWLYMQYDHVECSQRNAFSRVHIAFSIHEDAEFCHGNDESNRAYSICIMLTLESDKWNKVLFNSTEKILVSSNADSLSDSFCLHGCYFECLNPIRVHSNVPHLNAQMIICNGILSGKVKKEEDDK